MSMTQMHYETEMQMSLSVSTVVLELLELSLS